MVQIAFVIMVILAMDSFVQVKRKDPNVCIMNFICIPLPIQTMMSVRMDCTTVTQTQTVQTQLEVLNVLAKMDFLEMEKLA